MQKRLGSLLLMLIVLFSLTACGGKPGATTSEESKDAETSTEAASAGSENEKTSTGDKKVLKVGVAARYVPWCYLDEKNQVTGIDPTILEELARRNGWEVEYVLSSFDGMFGNLDTGKVDTIAQQITATPARAEKYLFSEVYAHNPLKLIVRADENDIKGAADLKGKIFVCQPTGVELEWITDYKKKNDPNDEIKVMLNEENQEIAVNTGKADADMYPVLTFDQMVEKGGYKLKMVGDVLYNEENVYPFKKDVDPAFFETFNKTLKEMKEDGFLTKLFMEQFNLDISKGEDEQK